MAGRPWLTLALALTLTWQDYFDFSYVQLSLGSLTVMLFMFLHWYSHIGVG